ncbi:MAG: C4-dicarboxylate ABC transporter [Clostridiales bacterium]|nr:C4-dicarboxylate ABC transporter [Clostridiales bacterium]
MVFQIISLVFLIAAIVLGFTKKMNVGIVSMGLAFLLGLIGRVDTEVILGGFPSKLFITLLGTMFFFCLLQDNHTLELLSKKMVALVGDKTCLIPVIIYLVSYLLSAAGPGAISVQSVMIIFAVSLAVQMKASPILLGSMAILGAVGGTTSPIALSGIIVKDLTAQMGLEGVENAVFFGVSAANFLCAAVLYIVFKGYRLRADRGSGEVLPKFTRDQLLCIGALLVLVVAVVGLRFDVGLVSFALAVVLMLCGVVNEKAAMKLIPWSVLILICGVNVLMAVTKELGGIELLSDILASLMTPLTASPIIGLTAGIMSWFSSANGVVLPTLIPTVPDIVANVGGGANVAEMIIAIVGGATVAGISPLSTGGSLILASFSQETDAAEAEQQSIFARLFLISFGAVMIMVVFALAGGFKLFC